MRLFLGQPESKIRSPLVCLSFSHGVKEDPPSQGGAIITTGFNKYFPTDFWLFIVRLGRSLIPRQKAWFGPK